MPPEALLFGAGIFLFLLGLSFCCFLVSKLRHQARTIRAGYRMVVFRDESAQLQDLGLTCAVCLEDFRTPEELGVLPCRHSFHKRCLLEWLRVRCACPMCNGPVCGGAARPTPDASLLEELL